MTDTTRQLTRAWIGHRANIPNKCGGKLLPIIRGRRCPCGYTARHEHCPGCGGLLAVGSGATIATIDTLRHIMEG